MRTGAARAAADLGGHPDAAAVLFDDLLADGQPQAAAIEVGPAVEAAERFEDVLLVLRLDADALIIGTGIEECTTQQFDQDHGLGIPLKLVTHRLPGFKRKSSVSSNVFQDILGKEPTFRRTQGILKPA